MEDAAINEYDIPNLDDTGSDGAQLESEGSSSVTTPQPIGQPMATAIKGLANSRSRAFGGEVASTLIAGATSQMSVELTNTKVELAEEREKNNLLRDELAAEKVSRAVLAERIDSFRSSRHLKNLGVAAGTILLGLGVPLFENSSHGLASASVVAGIVILGISWWSAPKVDDQ